MGLHKRWGRATGRGRSREREPLRFAAAGILGEVEAARTRDAGQQVFHLVGQDAAIAQDEVLVPVGHLGHIQQWHVCLLGRAAAFAGIAVAAGGDRVGPGVTATARDRHHVIAGKIA